MLLFLRCFSLFLPLSVVHSRIQHLSYPHFASPPYSDGARLSLEEQSEEAAAKARPSSERALRERISRTRRAQLSAERSDEVYHLRPTGAGPVLAKNGVAPTRQHQIMLAMLASR